MRFVSSPILHGPPQRSHFVYLLSHRTFATRTLNISCSLSPLSYSRGHIDRNKTGTSLQQYDPAMENTSGANDPVWVANLPFSKFPIFPKLTKNIVTDVITGVSTAYELVEQGRKVTLIDSRNILSGETARTSGHWSMQALNTIYFVGYLTCYVHRFGSR